jgi:hypothetical protein
MHTVASARPPRWYFVVSAIAVLWMLFGVFAWVMDVTTDHASVATLSEGQRQLYAIRPGWVVAIYGLAILSGLAGAVGLLLRRSWAGPALAISLAAAVVQFGYFFLAMNAVRLIGAAQAIPFPLVIIAIGILLLSLAATARKRGWIPGG